MNVKKSVKLWLITLVISLVVTFVSLGQTTNLPIADSNTVVSNQAPDEVMAKLSDLIHTEKYTEAQQLTSGLLLAYPNDRTLIKAKTLLDILVTPKPADVKPNNSQSANEAESNTQSANKALQLTPKTSSDQLTGMDKVEYNSLIELGREARQTVDPDQQKLLLQQFMDQSAALLQQHPNEMLLWELRASSAIMLNNPEAGYEAGHKLLSSAVVDNDLDMQRLLSLLNLKGWLDKQKIEEEKNQQNYEVYGWLLGTWNVSRSLDETLSQNFNYPDLFPGPDIQSGNSSARREGQGEKEEFVKSGMIIEGYEIASDGTRSVKPDLRGTITDSGKINWECYLPSSESDGIYVFRISIWGLTKGRIKSSRGGSFYPSGWLPVNSSDVNDSKNTLTIVIPIQWSRASSDSKNVNPETLLFTKDGSQTTNDKNDQRSRRMNF